MASDTFHHPNSAGYLDGLCQWLSSSKGSYGRILEAFEAECALEQEKLSILAQRALLHPEEHAVGCVAFGRVEMLQEIVRSLRTYKPE